LNRPRIEQIRLITVAGLLLLLSPAGFAQSFGLKFAYPTADALQVTNSDPNVAYATHSRSPKFGITGELGLGLPAGLLVEFGALYSHWSYASTTVGVDALIHSTTAINAWDIPVMVKKRFLGAAVRPYVNAGAAFRAVNEDTFIAGAKVRAPEFIHQATAGYAAGFGIDFKIGKLHVLPEFRYTQFQRDNFRSLNGGFHSNLSQPMFVLGFQRSK
jgi:opacity protein-like surface antigen